jgi:hypothetical protein
MKELAAFSDIELLYGLSNAFSEQSRSAIADELLRRGIALPARDDRRAKAAIKPKIRLVDSA